MWLRTALLLVLGLLAWKFLSGLLRSLSSPARDEAVAPKPGAAGPAPTKAPPGRHWPPGDVVDVPFRDVGDGGASSR